MPRRAALLPPLPARLRCPAPLPLRPAPLPPVGRAPARARPPRAAQGWGRPRPPPAEPLPPPPQGLAEPPGPHRPPPSCARPRAISPGAAPRPERGSRSPIPAKRHRGALPCPGRGAAGAAARLGHPGLAPALLLLPGPPARSSSIQGTKIIRWFGLDLTDHGDTFQQTRLLQALPSLALDISEDGRSGFRQPLLLPQEGTQARQGQQIHYTFIPPASK